MVLTQFILLLLPRENHRPECVIRKLRYVFIGHIIQSMIVAVIEDVHVFVNIFKHIIVATKLPLLTATATAAATATATINALGRDSIPVRRPDSQSRESGFKSHCGRFEPLASLITPRCHSSLSCINEYLAIQTVVDM